MSKLARNMQKENKFRQKLDTGYLQIKSRKIGSGGILNLFCHVEKKVLRKNVTIWKVYAWGILGFQEFQ